MKNLKKAVSVILSIAMVFSLMAFPAYATTPMTVSVGSASASAGGTVSVDLSIADNTDLSALSVYVYYKANVLTCTAANTMKDSKSAFSIWKQFADRKSVV